MKKAIIFSNGTISKHTPLTSFISSQDLIICADGGIKHAIKYNLHPHVVIGDGDSLTKSHQQFIKEQNITHISYPKDKNETDTELAITYAIKQGVQEIIFLGALGKRTDQTLANILLLTQIPETLRARIINGNEELMVVRKHIEIRGISGDMVSLIPLSADVTGITTQSLLYPLQKETLTFGKTRGVSNAFISTSAHISVSSGQLLVVHTKQVKT